MAPQSLEEMETHLNMVAADRSRWEVFTDDPVWIGRLEKLGFVATRITGVGKEFVLSADQVVIRQGKRRISEEQRAAQTARLHAARKAAYSPTDAEGQKTA